MTKTNKLLRSFVPQEVVALLEKIDSTDSTSDSSFRGAKTLLRDGDFNWFERKLIKHAVSKISRRETLGKAMNVVVFNNIDGEVRNDQSQWDKTGVVGSAGGTLWGASTIGAMVDAKEQVLIKIQHEQLKNQAGIQAAIARQQMDAYDAARQSLYLNPNK